MRCDLRISVAVAVGLGLGVSVALQATSAHAQDYLPATSVSTPDPGQSKPANEYSPKNHFFVEFRARNAASYGHMYVMYGEANARHEVIRSQIAGFFPAGDAQDCENCSVYYWSIGHILPVPSEIAASDGDLEEAYVLARYRVWIDQAQYERLVAYIEHRKANKGLWHAFFNNCVTFGRDVAVFIGLNVPPVFAIAPSVVLYPKTVVEMLIDANGGEKDEGPLKDAPGVLPPEIAAEFGASSPSSAKRTTAKKAKAHIAVEQKTFVSAASSNHRTANATPQDDRMSDSVH
jgi:hypothetical protein